MLIRTIRCKLVVAKETEQSFLDTRDAFAKACNLVLAKALETKTRNAVELHHLAYGLIRKECRLSANLAVRAIRRVAGSLSQKKKKRPKPNQFRPGSIEYDARIFTFWEADFRVSLTTTSKIV